MQRPVVLVADAHERQAKLYRDLFDFLGVEVHRDARARDAFLRVQDLGPDLLVTDAWFPDGSGLDLVEWLRGTPRFTALPILVVTACRMKHDLAGYFAAGASAFLP